MRAIIRLVDGPDLRPGFGIVHSAILGEGGDLRPNFPRRAVIGDLKDRMLQCLVGQLDVKRPVQSENAGIGRKDDREQWFQPTALPGGVECGRPANHQDAPAHFAAIARQNFLLSRCEVSGPEIREHHYAEGR